MDRNTITGIILIALILIGSTFFLKTPPEADKSAANKGADSTAVTSTATNLPDSVTTANQDSLNAMSLPADWATFAKGQNKTVTIENEDIKAEVSSKGGRITYVQLKKYKTYDGRPLILLNEQSSKYGLEFPVGNTTISTQNLYFTPSNVTAKSVTMSLEMPGGKSIKQTYALDNTGYLVNHSVSLNGLQNDIPKRNKYLDLNWESKIMRAEKDSTISAHATTVFFKKQDESPSNLSETKDEEEKFKDKTEWVSFKQQFFCQTLISSKLPFINAELSTQAAIGTHYQKNLTAQLTLPYNHAAVQQYDMQFYYGPLHYKTLKNIGLSMEKQIPLGWFLFNLVNRFIIIPVFNFLSQFIGNYGVIIFLLTIFIKLIVTPLTYKSYVSTAKMRVLKPELDELKEKYGEDMTRLQQEQMKLYRKAGVSPFGGCLPLLLQFPFLIAMFRFFPASIELRQEHFLWAHDLSTYDSIYTLPFHIPAYGNHVSLFTLLMTVSTLIYTRMNNSLSPQQNEFKWMSYLMPIFFLGFFNNYAAGLSLYYFYFNILTFLQQYLFKVFVNDKKLHAIIEENKKKPQSEKKGGFQKRLEDLAKKQQEMQKNKAPKPPRRK